MKKSKIIDTHCHLSTNDYEDLYAVMDRNVADKVIMIASCSDKLALEESKDLQNLYKDNIYLTVGIHPGDDKYKEEDIEQIKKRAKEDEAVVAIGEIGLDYYWEPYDKDRQIDLFEKQLAIATELSLPVVIHSRKATKDTIDTLKKYELKGVIHCFSGSYEAAKEYIKMGYKLGIGGVLTFKNSNLPKTIEKIDIKHIVLETDSPYLAPEPKRGKKNEPRYLRYVAERLAEIKGLNTKEVIEICNENARQMFDLNI